MSSIPQIINPEDNIRSPQVQPLPNVPFVRTAEALQHHIVEANPLFALDLAEIRSSNIAIARVDLERENRLVEEVDAERNARIKCRKIMLKSLFMISICASGIGFLTGSENTGIAAGVASGLLMLSYIICFRLPQCGDDVP